MTKSPWLKNLLHRRVPQIMGAYLGAGLAVIPFFGFLVDTYDFPKSILDAIFVAYVAMIPSVFLLAYNHGAPGKDPWGTAERVGVPINLLLTLGLLGYLFVVAPSSVEATTDTVVITDDEGNVTEHLVPKAKFRRKLGLFFWANESGDPTLDWLRYGFPAMLERDLEQNRFVAASTPFGGSLLTRLQRAGFEDGLDVPVALQQTIADDASWGTFVDGRFTTTDGVLSASVVLYDAGTAELMAEHTASGEDPTVLVDELTDWLKSQLEIDDSDEVGRDLPVGEQLSANREALERWVDGRVASRIGSDLGSAIQAWQEAVTLDKSFARAHFDIAVAFALLGKLDEAKVAAKDLNKHHYRLTERDQFFAKGLSAQFDLDMPRAMKSFETAAKLFPDDVEVLSTLGLLYKQLNRIEDAIDTYQRIADFDPSEDWAVKEIGDLHIAQRDYKQALAVYQRFAERHEDDAGIRFSIARLQQVQGQLDAARQTIEEARPLASDPIEPTLLLVELDRASGELDSAVKRLESAAAEAEAPQDVARVLEARLDLASWTGRMREALELWPQLREAQMQIAPPISILIQEGFLIPTFQGKIGERAEAEAWIEQHVAKLDAPYDRFRDLYLLQLYTVLDNAEGIDAHLDKSRETLEMFGARPDSMATLDLARGRALELRGDAAGAEEAYRTVMDSLANSTLNTIMGSELRVQCLELHARAAIDAGKLDAAAVSLDEALTTLPAHPAANVQMARLEQARGNLDAAREHLGRALDVWAEADAEFRPLIEAQELAAELGV